MVAVQNEREWRAFCEYVLRDEAVADDARFAGNAARCANRRALDEAIEATVSRLERDELIERLRAGRVAYASVNSVAELSTHGQLRRVTVPAPSGPVDMPVEPT